MNTAGNPSVALLTCAETPAGGKVLVRWQQSSQRRAPEKKMLEKTEFNFENLGLQKPPPSKCSVYSPQRTRKSTSFTMRELYKLVPKQKYVSE